MSVRIKVLVQISLSSLLSTWVVIIVVNVVLAVPLVFGKIPPGSRETAAAVKALQVGIDEVNDLLDRQVALPLVHVAVEGDAAHGARRDPYRARAAGEVAVLALLDL